MIERLWNGSCEETEPHLSAHLDGELRGLRRVRVLRHLARCELCRSVLASLQRTVEHLHSLARAEPATGASAVDAVVERIRLELQEGLP